MEKSGGREFPVRHFFSWWRLAVRNDVKVGNGCIALNPPMILPADETAGAGIEPAMPAVEVVGSGTKYRLNEHIPKVTLGAVATQAGRQGAGMTPVQPG